MTERDVVSGLLRGSLKLRDLSDWNYWRFQDVTMARVHFAAETLLLNGMQPLTRRIMVAFDALHWDKTGVVELIEELKKGE